MKLSKLQRALREDRLRIQYKLPPQQQRTSHLSQESKETITEVMSQALIMEVSYIHRNIIILYTYNIYLYLQLIGTNILYSYIGPKVYNTVSKMGWSNWSSWSACSRTCGNGEMVRSRTCTAPCVLNENGAYESKKCFIVSCLGMKQAVNLS